MHRPVCRPKLGTSYLSRWKGLVWRVGRATRHGYLRVLDCQWENPELSGPGRLYFVAKGIAVLKPQTNGVKGTGKLAADDATAFKSLPNWRAFFLHQTYDDGVTERQPGLLIIKPTGDGWQWTLKDPTSCTMLRVQSRTWDEGMTLVEGLLGSATCPWETDPYEAGKRSRSRGRKA